MRETAGEPDRAGTGLAHRVAMRRLVGVTPTQSAKPSKTNKLCALYRPGRLGRCVRRSSDISDLQSLRIVFLLRLLLWMAPPLNYALALSSVCFRRHLIGTALGLLAPIAAIVFLSNQLFG
jgi:hypothetical protein